MLVFLALFGLACGHGGSRFSTGQVSRFPSQNRDFESYRRPQFLPPTPPPQPSYGRPQFVPPIAPPQPTAGRRSNDCVTEPGPWGPCSATCGGGVQKRTQQIVQQPSGYGAECPALHEETQTCNNQPCPIDCVVEVGQYGACSATCGTGTQTKIDIIITEAKYGGRACPPESQLTQTIQCPNLPPCPVPVDCRIGYSAYSQCSAPCGDGFKTRTAYVISEAQFGGAPCPADLSLLTDTVACNDGPCQEPEDCEFIEGEYGECNAQCGQGFRKRNIYIISQPTNGGKACPFELTQTEPCYNLPPCPQPVDCVVQFSPFSACSATCNGGTQYAHGQIVTQASAGGAPCPDYSQLSITRSCGNTPCFQAQPRDCLIEYGQFSECSATCGYGTRTRKGYVVSEGAFGGLQCPAPHELIETATCDFLQPCPVPVDCKVQRAYWSECSAPCGGGSQTRTVTILQQAQYGGLPCPSRLTESRPCNTEPCQAPPTPSPVPAPYGSRNNFPTPSFKPTFNIPQRINRPVVQQRLPAQPTQRLPTFSFNRYGQ